jgi:hypothetical protein
VDYLRLNYDTNPDLIYTFSVSYSGTPYVGTPADTHTFQVYSSATNIAISAIAFETELFTRSLTAKVMNDKGSGVYIPLHPKNKIIWNIPNSYMDSVTATKLDGTVYDFTSYTDDTLIFDIQTSRFNLSSIMPTLCTINIYASAYDTYNTPTRFLTNTSTQITIDTFPETALFDSYLQINQENNLSVNDIWRVWTASYLVTAIDHTVINGTNVLTGARSFTLGDGRSLTSSTSSFTYPTTGTYSIDLIRSGVSAAGWLSAHKIISTIDLHLISRYLSANFILYPTYVFVTSALQVVNNLVDPITSFGVSAYDVNHTEPFILSALEGTLSNYVWSVGSTTLSNNTSSVIYNHNTITPTSGLQVKLSVYNTEMPAGMPTTYKNDSTGVITNYPNVKETDNSSVLFENLKMVNYTVPVITITDASDNLFLPFDSQVSATHLTTYPANVPIEENSFVMYWVLSTPNWTIHSNALNFNTNLTVGNDDTIVGVIKNNATYPLVLSLVRQTNSYISNSFPPSDWGISQQSVETSKIINYQTVPDLLFIPDNKFNLINDSVVFVNTTEQNPAISSFYVNDGYHTTNYYLTAFENFETSYPESGTYSLSISGNTNRGFYTNILSNIVTILSSFEPFDPTVSRVFGATELTLPISFESVQIPPNEWVTANNFNNSIDLLNANLTYLENMTRFYNFPPIAETGWLGLTYTGITSSFRWYDPNLSDYFGLSASVSNNFLSEITDITFQNNKLYVSDHIGIKIFDNNYNPQLLNTIINKTYGDPISLAKSIGVDSIDRLYVLDQPKNRVLVFAPYIDSTNPKSNEFLFEWGGNGSILSKTMFNNPNELYIDSNDNVWVVDTGNKCLKKYTRTGGWLQTYDLSDNISGTTVFDGGMISIAFDSLFNIHVLTKDNVKKFDSNGKYLTSYTFRNTLDENPQKILAADGNGFLYICLQTSVVKVLENGNYAGIFATNIQNAAYTSVFHTHTKDFYIANSQNILRYVESNVINSSSESSINQYIWSDEDIHVKPNENVEHWVINRVLKRLWDNIDLFKRSLKGEITYTTDDYGRPMIEIRNFTPTQYNNMVLTPKANVFIGLNEIVSNTTLNRCFKQLYNDFDMLKTYV